MTQAESKSSSQQSQLIVLGVVTLVLVLGGYFAYARFIGNTVPIGKELEVGEVASARRMAAMAMGNRIRNRANIPQPMDVNKLPDGIRSIGARQVSVKSGDYFTQLPQDADAPDNVRLYTSQNIFSPELDAVLQSRVELVMNQPLAKQLAITQEQIDKLTKVPVNRGGGLRLDKGDRDEIKTLWKAVISAPAGADKDAATQKFIEQLKVIGERNIEPTKQLMQKRADEIKAILTPEQMQKYLATKGIKS